MTGNAFENGLFLWWCYLAASENKIGCSPHHVPSLEGYFNIGALSRTASPVIRKAVPHRKAGHDRESEGERIRNVDALK